MRVDWDAVSAVAAALGAVVAIAALVSGLSQRSRLRSRLRHALELLAALPQDDHHELRRLLNETVELTSTRLVRLEHRYVERLRPRSRSAYRNSTGGWLVLGIVLIMSSVAAAPAWLPVEVRDSLRPYSWAAFALVIALAILIAVIEEIRRRPRQRPTSGEPTSSVCEGTDARPTVMRPSGNTANAAESRIHR